MDVIRRLDYLLEMGDQLVKTPDPCGVIPNITAIIIAYRTRQLEWNEGLVTYWSKGKQLCEPRPFHYGEFLDVNKQHDGHNDFWVEGVSSRSLQSNQKSLIDPERLIRFSTSSFSHQDLRRN
jgi:hypothetical protein